MNIAALKFINNNAAERLVEQAKRANRDPDTVLGITKQILAENGVDNLTQNQRFNFDRAILPLIHNLPCQGFKGEFDDEPLDCPNHIDDGLLLECYEEDTFLCENCRDRANDESAARQSWNRHNAD